MVVRTYVLKIYEYTLHSSDFHCYTVPFFFMSNFLQLDTFKI